MSVRIVIGDAIEQLQLLPGNSVHCCVTSPPYYGLRDYGVTGQIGLEPTPDEYIAALVAVFREVRRVLRSDGTLWVNIGDSYNAAGRIGHGTRVGCKQGTNRASANGEDRPRATASFLKPKDLLGIPWMLAFALRADGWYLRQDIIWSKPNPMPESVIDRCTKAHEYLFLLSHSERYWFDAAAIAEPMAYSSVARLAQPSLAEQYGSDRVPGKTNGPMKAVRGRHGGRRPDQFDNMISGAGRSGVGEGLDMRNKRSVWEVTTQPFSEAHFATFPPALIEPCILAGCPRGGTVIDPFAGAGTTGLVADRLGRAAILIEINPLYAGMAERRIYYDGPLFADVNLSPLKETAAAPMT